jgi:hypothetical protein
MDCRRPVRDYERLAATGEAMVKLAGIHRLLLRLEPEPQPEFRYRKKAA